MITYPIHVNALSAIAGKMIAATQGWFIRRRYGNLAMRAFRLVFYRMTNHTLELVMFIG